jgi:hypothetical protein
MSRLLTWLHVLLVGALSGRAVSSRQLWIMGGFDRFREEWDFFVRRVVLRSAAGFELT